MKNNRKKQHPTASSLQQFANEEIKRLRTVGKIGTANNYATVIRSFHNWTTVRSGASNIDGIMMAGYAAYLSDNRGLCRNSVSFHMRILRAILTKLEKATGNTPSSDTFQNVYTGIDRTRSKAIDASVVNALRHLDIPQDRATMNLARDTFLLTYYTRGMAFIDAAHLRPDDISDGGTILSYVRQKTGQRLYIAIEPCLKHIIEKYVRHNRQRYILPWLNNISEDENTSSHYSAYKTAINTYNRNLHYLSRLLKANGTDAHLTSYVSRHSWATAARKHNIPLCVISAALGHMSEKTTEIYLASIENPLIDEANKLIINALEKY